MLVLMLALPFRFEEFEESLFLEVGGGGFGGELGEKGGSEGGEWVSPACGLEMGVGELEGSE